MNLAAARKHFIDELSRRNDLVVSAGQEHGTYSDEHRQALTSWSLARKVVERLTAAIRIGADHAED